MMQNQTIMSREATYPQICKNYNVNDIKSVTNVQTCINFTLLRENLNG
jgi:hypothetical protein